MALNRRRTSSPRNFFFGAIAAMSLGTTLGLALYIYIYICVCVCVRKALRIYRDRMHTQRKTAQGLTYIAEDRSMLGTHREHDAQRRTAQCLVYNQDNMTHAYSGGPLTLTCIVFPQPWSSSSFYFASIFHLLKPIPIVCLRDRPKSLRHSNNNSNRASLPLLHL